MSRPLGIVIVLRASGDPQDVEALCRGIAGRVTTRKPAVIECDVAGVIDADAVVIDTLARIALIARRAGARVRVRGASGELRALLALAGLDAVLPCLPGQSSRRRGSPKSGK